jgi:anti-sigma regulatory factor (Ser/Thr protein kinase)
MKSQLFSFTLSQPEQIYPTLTRLLKNRPIPFHLQSDLFLSLFEAVQNAFQHGRALAKKMKVRVEIRLNPRQLEARVYDPGFGFKLSSRKKRAKKQGERGRGLIILRQLNDVVLYRKGKKENCLILRKKIVPPAKRYQMEDLLYEISRRLNESPRLQKVYEIVLDKLIKVFNVERASIMMYEPAENALKVVAARGIRPSLLKKIRVKEGEGISGDVFKHSKPLLIEGAKNRRHYQTRSFISVPVVSSPFKVGEETLGVINLTDKLDGSRFTKSELKLLSEIAHHAAAYIKIGALVEELVSPFGKGGRRGIL